MRVGELEGGGAGGYSNLVPIRREPTNWTSHRVCEPSVSRIRMWWVARLLRLCARAFGSGTLTIFLALSLASSTWPADLLLLLLLPLPAPYYRKILSPPRAIIFRTIPLFRDVTPNSSQVDLVEHDLDLNLVTLAIIGRGVLSLDEYQV